MNVLIIFSHPGKKSYTFQILEQLKTEFSKQNWVIEISDLYAMNFQTDMSEKEYEREGLLKTELPIYQMIDKNCHQRLALLWLNGINLNSGNFITNFQN